MTGFKITQLVTLIANYIACNIEDDDELSLIGAVLTQARRHCSDNCNSKTNL